MKRTSHVHAIGSLAAATLLSATALAAPSVPRDATTPALTFDLISSSTCTTKGTRLVSCSIPTQSLTSPDITTAVPMRTTIAASKSGSCSTPYALELTLQSDNADPVRFPFLSQATASIRRKDGAPLPLVTITDSSHWTSTASFDTSCKISASVVSNELDINSKNDALAVIAQLEQDVAAKIVIRDHYHDLYLFQSAYTLLKAVSDHFYTEVTNDGMQELRSANEAAYDALGTLIISCETVELTPQDKDSLLRLYVALANLGSASSYQNPDGSTMTLAQWIGPSNQQVLNTVNQINLAHPPDGTSSYQADYQLAATDVVRAQAKLDLARSQLSTWLQ